LLFPEVFAKPVTLEFDQRQGSSDGGAVLLKAAERRYGLIANMSGCLRDPRQAGKVDHSLRDLFAQRVFSIGCGYADANDSARLSADPASLPAFPSAEPSSRRASGRPQFPSMNPDDLQRVSRIAVHQGMVRPLNSPRRLVRSRDEPGNQNCSVLRSQRHGKRLHSTAKH
jgi:hypothetical protein